MQHREIRYNSFYRTFDEMKESLKEYNTCLTEDDFKLLKALYHYKIKCGTIQQVLLNFLKHFKIKYFNAYSKIQVKPKIFSRKTAKMLFHIMPLTRGEYIKAIKLLSQSGKIEKIKMNNGRRKRYRYVLNEKI